MASHNLSIAPNEKMIILNYVTSNFLSSLRMLRPFSEFSHLYFAGCKQKLLGVKKVAKRRHKLAQWKTQRCHRVLCSTTCYFIGSNWSRKFGEARLSEKYVWKFFSLPICDQLKAALIKARLSKIFCDLTEGKISKFKGKGRD